METNKLSDGVSTFEPLETSLSLDSTKCHYPHLVPFLDIKNVSPSGIHIPSSDPRSRQIMLGANGMETEHVWRINSK